MKPARPVLILALVLGAALRLGAAPMSSANYKDPAQNANSAGAIGAGSANYRTYGNMGDLSGVSASASYQGVHGAVFPLFTTTLPSGCGAGFNVAKSGGDFATIQAAVNNLPKNMLGNECVVIRDAQTYNEQVTVQGFTNNGFRLSIMRDPAFVSSGPIVSPPAASTAAFIVANASVSIAGFTIAPTVSVSYGVLSSSANVTITSVTVSDAAGSIALDGMRLTGNNFSVTNSSVAVNMPGNASIGGIYITGSNGQVSFSTAVSLNTGVSLSIDAGASSNTVSHCYMSASVNPGMSIRGAKFNTVSLSTFTAGIFLIRDASSTVVSQSNIFGFQLDGNDYGSTITGSTITNSININTSYTNTTQSFIAGAAGPGVVLNPGAAYNTISQSTITGSAGWSAISITGSSQTTIVNDYIQGSTAVYVTGSTGTVIGGSFLAATGAAGYGLQLSGGSVGLTLTSTTVLGGAGGAGVYLDQYNSGLINLSTNVIASGAQKGIYAAAQTAGTQVFITSNTIRPSLSTFNDTFGLFINGLQTGATIQNNGIYWRTSGSMSGFTSYGLFATNSSGLVIDHNRISDPGSITAGSFLGADLTGTTNSAFKFNDVNVQGTSLTNGFLLTLLNASTNNTVKDNIFLSSMVVTGSSATIKVDVTSQVGFVSNYNDFFSSATGGGNAFINTAICGANAFPLTAWTCNAVIQDAASLAANPLWFNTSAGVEDFHPLSSVGRCANQGNNYFFNATCVDANDGANSPTINAGDPAEPFNRQPSGTQTNLGSTGNTGEASQFALGFNSCSTVETVCASGCNAATIGAALALIPNPLTGYSCVIINDQRTYNEGVTVQNFTMNGSSLTIMTNPGQSAPAVVTPPSVNAFSLINSSVNLAYINILPNISINYGVSASSPNVTISSVNVIDPVGRITVAGIRISSLTSVAFSSITETNPNAHGFFLTGYGNSISYSTAGVNAAAAYALYLDISTGNTITGSYFSNSGGVGAAFVAAASNTITQSYVFSPVSDAVDLGANSNNNVISQSTFSTVAAWKSALYLSGASFNSVSGAGLSSPNGWGLALQSANNNAFSQSLITCGSGGGGQYAVWLGANGGGASYNSITQSTLSNSVGAAVHEQSGSNFNTISLSTITGGPSFAGAELFNSSFTSIVNDYVQGSTAVYISGSTGTLVGGSVLVAGNAGGSGLLLTGGSGGLTLSSSTIFGGSQSFGVYLDKSNTGLIILSTNTLAYGAAQGVGVATQTAATQVWITSNTFFPSISPSFYSVGLGLNGLISGATIQNNSILFRTLGATGGYAALGMNLQSSSGLVIDHNRIDEPGMITGGIFAGVNFIGTSNSVFKFNDVNAAATVAISSGFAVLVQNTSTGISLRDNIIVTSFTVSGANSSSATIVVDPASQAGFASDYNDFFSSTSFNTIVWGGVGVFQFPWTGGTGGLDPHSISADPLWANVAAGAEDFHPKTTLANGRFDPATGLYDLTDAAASPTIDAGDPAEPFNLEPFNNGTRVNLGSYGNTSQASKSPLSPGCDVEYTVGQGFIGSISQAVSQIAADFPGGLTKNPCVVIRTAGPDSGLWSEQVDIRGIGSNNHRLTIMPSPNLLTRTVVNPGGATTAGFVVANTSVTIYNIDIKPSGGTVPYGILATSANVTISSVNVDSGGNITTAGISISSWTTVTQASVTVQAATGINLVGMGDSISLSTMANTAPCCGAVSALFLANASSNAIINSYVSNQSASGVSLYLLSGSNGNIVSQSTITTTGGGHAAFYVRDSSSNTITGSYISGTGAGGIGLDFEGTARFNTVTQSSMVTPNAGLYALYIGASSNTIAQSYITNPNSDGAHLDSNATFNMISLSTMIAGGQALYLAGASSNSVNQCVIYSPGGNAAVIDSNAGYNTISRSALTSNAAAARALYINGAYNNVVTQSVLSNPPGFAALLNNANYNSISFSTIANSAASIAAVQITASSSTLIVNDYVQGSTAVFISGSTGTLVGGSMLVAANAGGSGLDLTGGSVGLSLSSSVLLGGSQGAGAFLNAGNSGLITISSNSFAYGAQYGISIPAQVSGTQVWITSNTIFPSVTNSNDTYGLFLNGLTSGATIQNNSVFYHVPGTLGVARTVVGMYFGNSSNLLIQGNRINNPGMITGGNFILNADFSATTNSTFKFNDLFSSGTAMGSPQLVQLNSNSNNIQIRDNIFVSSFSAPTGSSATIQVDATSVAGFSSNYNDFYSLNGIVTGICNGVAAQLPNWACNGAQDGNSLFANPLWLNTQGSSEDFHPLSKLGRCTNSPSCTSFASDSLTSPTIDAADPAEPVGLEQAFNGGRANQGSYGQTLEASKSPAAPGAPSLLALSSTTASVTFGFVAGTPPDFYQVDASTAANFTGTVFSSRTPSAVLAVLSPQGLSANTTYFFRTESLWNPGTTVYALPALSTATAAADPLSVVSTFTTVTRSSITAAWQGNANPAGTIYEMRASTASDFSGVLTSSLTYNVFASSAGLAPNTTYFFQASALNSAGARTNFVFIGSTSTLAAPPGPAASTFTNVFAGGLTVNWSSGAAATKYNPLGTTYVVQISTDQYATINASSRTANLFASFTGLIPQTTYSLQVEAVNNNGIATGFVDFGSTLSYSSPPTQANPSFSPVFSSSLTVNWSANGDLAGTTWYAQISTAASFSPILASSQTYNLFAAFAGLSVNVTYYAQAAAFNSGTSTWTAFSNLGATSTLTSLPVSAVATYTAVALSSITAAWQNGGNPGGTRYWLEVSTSANFSGVVTSSLTYNVFASTAGLAPNTTYYFQAAGLSRSGAASLFASLGSTSTLAAAPAISSVTVIAGGASLQVNLNPNGNPAGTLFAILTSTDPNPLAPQAGAVVTSSSTYNTYLSTAGLFAATTYYFAARALNNNGVPSSFTAVASTMTLPAGPGASPVPFPSVSVSSIAAQWLAGANPPGASYLAEASTDAFATVNASSLTLNFAAAFGAGGAGPALAPNTTYFFRVTGVAGSGAGGTLVIGSTATLAAPPAAAAQTFISVSSSVEIALWSANGNPLGKTTYTVVLSTGPGYPNADAGNVTLTTAPAGSPPSATLSGLLGLTTYYLFVSAVNYDGLATTFTALGSSVTASFGLPVITNNQTGDAAWRNSSPLYNVSFADFSGSHLSKFQVEASTMPGGAGPFLIGFTDVFTNINTDSFPGPWAIPASVFNALIEGPTNYITVKAFNGLGGTAAVIDAFFVKKDSTPPSFVNGTGGGSGVVLSAPGTLYNLQAFDKTSGLAAFQYSASLTQGSGDASLIAWTDVAPALVAGSTYSAASWQVSFGALTSLTTNYISVRAWDVAGATAAIIDAFTIRKDTIGPTVAVTAPTQPNLSALNAISGTSADPLGIKGVEVSIQENPGGAGPYWDGASAFGSGTPVWIVATGTSAWTLPPAAIAAAMQDGKQYQIVARSSNTADIYSSNYSTTTFLMDRSTPTAGVTLPANSAVVSSALTVITGTAKDVPLGAGLASGLAAVQMSLQRVSDKKWWNFFADVWGSTSVVVSTTLATAGPSSGATWTFLPDSLLQANLASGSSYFIAVAAVDKAFPANTGSPFTALGSTFTFTDTTAPAPINDLSGHAGLVPGQISLTWHATGDDGNSGVILSGRYAVAASTNSGFAFSTSTALVIFSTTTSPGTTQFYTLGGLKSGSTYYVHLFLSDSAGNWSSLSNAATAQAESNPLNQIQGHVVNLSTQGITGVQLQAYDDQGKLAGTTYTVDDGSGTYDIAGLPAGSYKVLATWTVHGMSSSVWIDGIPMGSVGIDFVLNLTYTLGGLTGTLSAAASALAASSRLAAAGPLSVSSNRPSGGGAAFVELWNSGRPTNRAYPQADGRWDIGHLLPGPYSVRAFNGVGYTPMVPVTVREGQIVQVVFAFDPLPVNSVYAYPNPARTSTTLRFESALIPLDAEISIFDAAGNAVKQIPGAAVTSPAPGVYHADWDLTNSRGSPVASGIYLFMVKLQGGPENQTAKVVKKVAVVR